MIILALYAMCFGFLFEQKLILKTFMTSGMKKRILNTSILKDECWIQKKV